METVVKANADKYTKSLKKQVETTRVKINGLLDDLIKKIDDTSSIEVKTEKVSKPKPDSEKLEINDESGKVMIQKDIPSEAETMTIEDPNINQHS